MRIQIQIRIQIKSLNILKIRLQIVSYDNIETLTLKTDITFENLETFKDFVYNLPLPLDEDGEYDAINNDILNNDYLRNFENDIDLQNSLFYYVYITKIKKGVKIVIKIT